MVWQAVDIPSPSLPGDPETYQQFGLYWLQQLWGNKWSWEGYLVAALQLALERPQQIDRALVFALFKWQQQWWICSYGY